MSPLETIPCSLPKCEIAAATNAAAVGESFVHVLEELRAEHFVEISHWRDTFALTGSLRTFHGPAAILAAWKDTTTVAKPCSFSLVPQLSRVVNIGDASWVDVVISFETSAEPQLLCTAILSVIPAADGSWKIWVLRTVLEQLKGLPNVDVLEPITNKESTHLSKVTNGLHQDDTSEHYDCVIVGGGQAGLSAAGRLKALGLTYIVIEKHKLVGDSWKSRYDSARLHTSKEYAHLPFGRTFDSEYPQLLHKDDLSRGYQDWVKKYDINVSLETTLSSGSWDEIRKIWSFTLQQRGNTRNITSLFVIMAVGGGCQVPSMPDYTGREDYHGIVQHSGAYKSAKGWKGMDGIIIGSANTAHDVAEDMLEAGLTSVTMVQRSKTYVLPAEHYENSVSPIFNVDVPTTVADKLFNSNPAVVARLITSSLLHPMAQAEPERYDALQRAGFKTDPYGDLISHLYERLGGHYMDVGASAKISDGLIKVKSDALPVGYTENGLTFSDGSELKADVIIFATGFQGNMRKVVRELLGNEVGDQVQDFWGIDAEGEINGAWKPSGHPGLFYHGGTVGQARYYARYIALQIKAKLLGTPLRVY